MNLGVFTVIAARLFIPWQGAWIADCEVDLGADQPLPTGRQLLTIGATTLSGTVDPRGTGRSGENASVRLVAGAGAWDTVVSKQDFANDASAGVKSTQVLDATAAQIGEVVLDPTPVSYGPQFTRREDRAVKVLDGRQWYVDAQGVTNVAAWPPSTLADTSDVLEYAPTSRSAVISTDEIVWPGTVITDSRFGKLTVRDIEHVFDKTGSRHVAWCDDAPISRIGKLLEAIGQEFDGDQWLKLYRYRVVIVGTDLRLQLQGSSPTVSVPDMLPLVVWPGLPGMHSKPTPGTMVLVAFLEGDPSKPAIVGFDGSAGTEVELDATVLVKLGANAVSPAAKSTIVDANFSATKTLASAISAYATAIQAVADPTNAATPTLLAAITAFLAAITPTPAVKVKVE